MSPSETKKAKRRRSKKTAARSPVGENSEGVVVSSRGVGNSSIVQSEKVTSSVEVTEDNAPQENSIAERVCLVCEKSLKSDITGKENGILNSTSQDPVGICQECKKKFQEGSSSGQEDELPDLQNGAFLQEQLEDPEDTIPACPCEVSMGWRSSESDHVLEHQELRMCWQILKQTLHIIYQSCGLMLGDAVIKQVVPVIDMKLHSDEEIKQMVSRLCQFDARRLFLCLKAQVQLFVVEMRLRLLRHLVANGPNSQVETALLDEYSKLCEASDILAPYLQELVTRDLKRHNLTWEMVNKHLFQAIVFSDPSIQSCLPDISSQRHLDKFKEAHSKLLDLDNEMALVSSTWKKIQQSLEESSQEQISSVTKHNGQKEWDRLSSRLNYVDSENSGKSFSSPRRPCSTCSNSNTSDTPYISSSCSKSTETVTQSTAHSSHRHSNTRKVQNNSPSMGHCPGLRMDSTWTSSFPSLSSSNQFSNLHCLFSENSFRSSSSDVSQDCRLTTSTASDRVSSLQCFHSPMTWSRPVDVCLPPPPPTVTTGNSIQETRSSNETVITRGKMEQANILKKVVAESLPCECHACSQPQCNNGGSLPPLPPVVPSGNKPLIHPHLYSSSPRNYQINLELESQDTLQQQTYLAACCDWDWEGVKPQLTSHKYSCSNTSSSSSEGLLPRCVSRGSQASSVGPFSPPPPPPLPETPPSPPPPPPPTSSQGPLSNHRHSQDGLCGDSDCDNHLLDGEDSIDDTCSERSSSTSTSNQRESRVCDCCYCEVFGHGMPAVAPVSKNYQEMRDRLRLRLSKRKAESAHTAKKQYQEEPHVDNREVEELLNFINGTENNKSSKATKRHKRKSKRRDETEKSKDALESKSHSPSPVSRLIEAVEIVEKQSPVILKSPVLEKKESRKENEARYKNVKVNSTERKSSPVLKQSPVPNGTVPSSALENLLNVENEKKASKETHHRKLENNRIKKASPEPQSDFKSNIRIEEMEKSNDQCNNQAAEKKDSNFPQVNGTQVNSKGKKTRKKKNSVEDATSPDEVFLPKDIDLENGDIDELEREVEAFKRFCFNSVPVANKEKVHVNLKDILVRKKPTSGSAGIFSSSTLHMPRT